MAQWIKIVDDETGDGVVNVMRVPGGMIVQTWSYGVYQPLFVPCRDYIRDVWIDANEKRE